LQYLRQLDREALELAVGRHAQDLLDDNLGVTHSKVMCIKTEPGGGSPEGLHSHEWDQLFYVVSGTLTIEIEGENELYEAGPDTLVCYPQGVRHRNWNKTSSPVVHLAINMSPLS
jgi:quercetin dioxygenase-like cupin family protein